MNKIKDIGAMKAIWILNLLLVLFYVSSFYGVQFIKSSILEYSNITSDPFDGTVNPITFVPNWLVAKNTNKSLNFSDETFAISDFMEIPKYDTDLMQDSTGKNQNAIITRYTYPVLYMGSYRLNYQEYDGSHPGVDIRAPIGTPVSSIANGVVIKIKDTETGDGKYVIIRHDNVNVNGNIETLYSGYEHLSSIVAIEGTKIKKGEVLGYVGITGITTTPHLHFQIDKKSAPFHAYWPYTFKDASDMGLDFFSAVNVGLGKENAIANTINPLEFIQNNIASDTQSLNSAPDISQINTSENNSLKNLSIDPNTQTSTNSVNLDTPIIVPDKIVDTPIIINEVNTKKLDIGQIFYDVSLNSKYYKATKYLYDNGITKGYDNGNFGIDNPVSRGETLIFLFKTFNIKTDSSTLVNFKDIGSDSFLIPYLAKSIDLGYISKNEYFRQNDTVTRAEFITMLIKASGKPIIKNSKSVFSDIKNNDWYASYVNTFASLFPSSSNMNFYPNSLFNRGQIGLILYSISKK